MPVGVKWRMCKNGALSTDAKAWRALEKCPQISLSMTNMPGMRVVPAIGIR